MTDLLLVESLYETDPTDVFERLATKVNGSELDHLRVDGPRTRFGTSMLDVTHVGSGPTLPVGMETIGDDDIPHLTSSLHGIEMQVPVGELDVGQTDTRVEQLLDLVQAVYEAGDRPPAYVYGLDPFHAAGVGEDVPVPVTEAGLDGGHIQDVSWLMLFPPDFADATGREKLSSAPAWHVEELEDGAVLLVAVADPTDPNGVDYSALREHFGVEDPGPGH